MDPRFRPISIEIVVAIALFMILFQTGIVTADATSPITLLFLAVLIAELVRILWKLRNLRKAGVDIDHQGMRSPVWDAVNPKVGDAYYTVRQWEQPLFWLIGIVFSACALAVIIVIVLYFVHF